MAFIRLDAEGVIVQKQPHPETGFVAAPDDVVVGMARQADGSYAPNVPVATLAGMKDALRVRVAAMHTEIAAKGVSYEFPGGLHDVIQTRSILDTTNVTGMVVAAQELKSQGVTDAV